MKVPAISLTSVSVEAPGGMTKWTPLFGCSRENYHNCQWLVLKENCTWSYINSTLMKALYYNHMYISHEENEISLGVHQPKNEGEEGNDFQVGRDPWLMLVFYRIKEKYSMYCTLLAPIYIVYIYTCMHVLVFCVVCFCVCVCFCVVYIHVLGGFGWVSFRVLYTCFSMHMYIHIHVHVSITLYCTHHMVYSAHQMHAHVVSGFGDFNDEFTSTGGTVTVTWLDGIIVTCVIVLQVTPANI